MKKLNVAIFGIGAVGQCLGYVLMKAGHDVTYIGKDGKPVTNINGKSNLTIDTVSILDNGETVNKINLNIPRVEKSAEFKNFHIIFITVGYVNIPTVASLLKRTLKNDKFLPNIIFLENYYEPEKLFLSKFSEYPKAKLIFGIPDVISYRTTKDYTRTLYPFTFFVGNSKLEKLINDSHFEYVDNIKTKFLQRLCSHNTAHNMLAYIGHAKNYKSISEAIADKDIRDKMIKALEEGAHGLVYKYGISMDQQKSTIKEEVDKLYVANFSDPIARVARTPIKKLNPYERFILPALLAYNAGLFPEALCEGIAYLFLYKDENDAEAVLLNNMLKSDGGIEKALEEFSGLKSNHPITQKVKLLYNNLLISKNSVYK